MLSKIATKIMAAMLLVPAFSCGYDPDNDSVDYDVGRKPEFYSASYLWRSGDQNAVVAVSKEGMTVQRFTLEPFAHVTTLPLPLDYERQGVVASANGEYYIALAEAEYAILKANGETNKNPMPLLGAIASIAFDPVHNLVVISDEFQTMAVLVLDAGGNVTGSWKAGSNFPGDRLVKSGVMLADGRLVLAIGTTTVAVVDVAASVAAQAWTFTEFEVAGATDIKWISSVPNDSDRVMAIDANRVLSLQISTGTLVAENDLTGKSVLGYFRDFVPHVVVKSAVDSSTQEITYMDAAGALVTRSIRGTDRFISQTLLDSAGTFTVVYNPDVASTYYGDEDDTYTRASVYRFRLSDNAGLDKAEVDDRVNLAITPNHLFLLFPSALGKAVRRSYGPNPNDQELEGYNLDIIRDRRKAE